MKGHIVFLPGMAAILVLCGACSDFFSSSLAPWAARDPSRLVPPVTVGNVRELILRAENNPDLSLEVLKGILDAVVTSAGSDRAALQAAALQAAANASGLGVNLLNQAGDLDVFTDPAMTKELVKAGINSSDNLVESGSVLAAALPNPDDDAAYAAFVAAAVADDLAMAAMVLLASEAKQTGDSSAYIDSFNTTGSPLNQSEKLALKLAESAAQKYDAEGGTGPLKDILDELHLISSP
jgi:hypothetical protein